MGAQSSSVQNSTEHDLFWRVKLNSSDEDKYHKLYEFAQTHPEFDLNFRFTEQGKDTSLLHALAADNKLVELLRMFFALEEAGPDGRRKLDINICVQARFHTKNLGMCTPLMASAYAGSTAIALELLKRNPELNVPGCETTALSLALSRKNDEMIGILRNYWQHMYGEYYEVQGTAAPTRRVPLGNPTRDLVTLMKDGAAVGVVKSRDVDALVAHCSKPGASPGAGAHGETHSRGDHGLSLLLRSAAPVDVDLMRRLIATGVDLVVVDSSGMTLLMLAARNGHASVVPILLEAGVDVNAADGFGDTALIIAARYGHASIVCMLVEGGADVNLVNNHEMSALHGAGLLGHAEVVRILIEARANVVGVDKDGMSALHLGARRGQVDVVRTLIGAGADVDLAAGKGMTPLRLAAKQGNVEVVGALLDAGASIDAGGITGMVALMQAAMNRSADAVALLVEAGAAVNLKNSNGMTALSFGLESMNALVVQTLLKAGADAYDEIAGDYISSAFAEGGEWIIPMLTTLLAWGAMPKW